MYKIKNSKQRNAKVQSVVNYTDFAYSNYNSANGVSVHEYLSPLLRQLHAYDAMRIKLETQGGNIADFEKTTSILNQPVTVCDRWGARRFKLSNQSEISSALASAGLFDLHMQVRRLGTGMPVYYLCRTRRDYFAEYSLIVEDIYCSSGYPIVDERFVKLMSYGHEAAFLRLSPFRNALQLQMDLEQATTATGVDDALYHVGRHVFQAAWHDDQRPGTLTARHFDLPCFQQAIELLYLCLSGELCELRNALDAKLIGFFESIYPQPSIYAFLGSLNELDGATINELPRKALKRYLRLSTAFSHFLNTEVLWGRKHIKTPIYKLIFANFDRLEMVATQLKDDISRHEAAFRLEQESQQIIEDLLSAL